MGEGTARPDALRVGLVGLGFAAWSLKLPGYAALGDRVRIVAVADPSPEARQRAHAELGVPEVDCHSDYQELLGRGDLDFVDISTPHNTHAEILLATAEAGMPMLCDKPVTVSLAEADLALGAAERHTVLTGVHRNYFFHSGWQKVWELLAEDTIGAPLTATLSATGILVPGSSDDELPFWRPRASISGGGILIDYGIHTIYLARRCLGGTQPSRVWAVMDHGPFAHGDVEDRATLVLSWDSGPRAVIDLVWGTAATGDSTVQGEQGALKVEYAGGRRAPHHAPLGVRVVRGRTDHELHEVDPQSDSLDWYYRGGIEAFIGALRGERSDAPTLADGRADLEVALAAYKSAALGTEVELPLSPTDPVYQRGVLGLRELDLPRDSLVTRFNLYRTGET